MCGRRLLAQLLKLLELTSAFARAIDVGLAKTVAVV